VGEGRRGLGAVRTVTCATVLPVVGREEVADERKPLQT
jgi:hypothetical protein